MWSALLFWAKHAKDTWDWLQVLGWIGFPGVIGLIAFFKDQPWDITLLYAMAGAAFWMIFASEALPDQRAKAKDAEHPREAPQRSRPGTV